MSMEQTLRNVCPARHACRQVGVPERCHTACAFYIDVTQQLALSGIPDEYRDITIETLPDNREFVFHGVLQGDDFDVRKYAEVAGDRKPKNGVFFTSETTGNGKTELACALAQSFILARTKKALREGRSIGQLVCFANTVELLALIKRGFDDEIEAAKSAKIIDRLTRAELVILDDIACERSTPWVQERFYEIVNGVWSRRDRQTLICTSNKTLDALELTHGDRIRSRIDGMCIVCEFRGSDKRRKRYGGAK